MVGGVRRGSSDAMIIVFFIMESVLGNVTVKRRWASRYMYSSSSSSSSSWASSWVYKLPELDVALYCHRQGVRFEVFLVLDVLLASGTHRRSEIRLFLSDIIECWHLCDCFFRRHAGVRCRWGEAWDDNRFLHHGVGLGQRHRHGVGLPGICTRHRINCRSWMWPWKCVGRRL